MTPREFSTHLAKGDFKPVYCLFGEESYLVDKETRRLIEAVVDPAFKDFNLSVYYATEAKGDEICEAALSLPMFAARRVVWIKRAESLSAAASEMLLDYLQNPSPSTCLVFQAGKLDQRKKLFLELKKQAVLVEGKKLYENQVPEFIVAEVKDRGKRISRDALELLAYLVGTNLQEVVAQVDKAILYVGERQEISADDVKAIVSDTKVDSIFEFTDAIGARQTDKALRCMHTILREKDAPLYVLNMIVRHFRQLWIVRSFLDRGTTNPDEIAKIGGLNPFVARKSIPQAKNFKPVQLSELFQEFLVTDLALKGGSGMPELVLERLVLKICGQG
jgi:DNA polymerase III subunit delta